MAESYEDNLRRIERRLLATPSVAGWIAALDEILAMGDAGQIAAALARITPPTMGNAAGRIMVEALDLALATSARLIHPLAPELATRLQATARSTFRFPAELLALAGELDSAATKAVKAATKVAEAGGGVDAILAPIRANKSATRIRVVAAVNETASTATRHASEEAGLPVVWVAERNACVRCLKYAGTVVEKGELFPGGLSYGSRVYEGPDMRTPKVHPYERCHLEPLRDQSYADALRREADRSVLRGFALESESRSARVDAAKTLLADGVDAPKSVIKFAERSIKKGNFGTTLRKPGGPAHDFTP